MQPSLQRIVLMTVLMTMITHLEAEGLIKIQEPHQSGILWMKQPSSNFETIVPGLVELFLIGTVHSRNNFIIVK